MCDPITLHRSWILWKVLLQLSSGDDRLLLLPHSLQAD
jgi:hypothetical protein